LAPSVDAQGQQFNFNPDQQQPPSQGFEFWEHIRGVSIKRLESSLLHEWFSAFLHFSWSW
jgi:hypothetical protein